MSSPCVFAVMIAAALAVSQGANWPMPTPQLELSALESELIISINRS